MSAVLLFASGGVAHARGDAQVSDIAVSEERDSAYVKRLRAVVDARLNALPGKRNAKVQRQEVSGDFVLWGDLFRTGKCYALLALEGAADEDSTPSGVALANWMDGRWELRGFWKIPTVWRPEEWARNEEDYLPVRPATQPFDLRDLSGDGRPEVLVAGEVDKYFQAYYLLHFDASERVLRAKAWSMGPPERVGEFVRLYSNSGRRAIYENWEFCRWSGADLRTVATWHEEVPYNNVDPPFVEVTVPLESGREEVFRVAETDLQAHPDADGRSPMGLAPWPESPFEEISVVTTERQPFAKLRIVWKPWAWDDRIFGVPAVKEAWLFERLTGLPRRFYPAAYNQMRVTPPLERFAEIRVEGDPDLAQRLRSGGQK